MSDMNLRDRIEDLWGVYGGGVKFLHHIREILETCALCPHCGLALIELTVHTDDAVVCGWTCTCEYIKEKERKKGGSE